MAEKLVTVWRFLWLAEADQAWAALRGYGIESYLADQHFLLWFPLHALALGGVKLRVRQSEGLDAREILQWVYATSAVHCPSCRSTNVRKTIWYGRRLLLLMLAGAFAVPVIGLVLFGCAIVAMPLAFRAKRYRCKACGFRWKEDNDRLGKAVSKTQAGQKTD